MRFVVIAALIGLASVEAVQIRSFGPASNAAEQAAAAAKLAGNGPSEEDLAKAAVKSQADAERVQNEQITRAREAEAARVNKEIQRQLEQDEKEAAAKPKPKTPEQLAAEQAAAVKATIERRKAERDAAVAAANEAASAAAAEDEKRWRRLQDENLKRTSDLLKASGVKEEK